MKTNAMCGILAGVAFSALAAQMGFAQPVAGLGGLKLPGAMVLIEAEAPADETPADEGTADEGTVDEGSGDVGVSDPGTDEPPVDEPPVEDGDTLVDPIDGWIDEPAPVDDDGMVWAGGDPDFCEACGGEVIEEPVVDDPVIEEPLPGDEGTDPVTGGEDPVVIDDDGMLYPGGDREFCENCRGETLPEVMYSTTGGELSAPTAGGKPLAARPDHDGAQSPMCRHRPKAPGCDN